VIHRLAPLAVAAALAGGYGVAAAVPVAAAGRTAPVGVAPGGGEAAGLEAPPLQTCVSCTSVEGGPDGPAAHATPLRLLGHDLARGGSRGGSSDRNAIVSLPSNPALDLAVVGWETGTAVGPAPAAWSRSALLDVGVLPAGEDSTTGGLLTVAVLESFSDAGWTGSGSHGYAATNGADIGVGDGALVVLLLHSQATSDGHDDAYLASVDGEAVGGSAGGTSGMPLEIPGVLSATLFAVRAGRDAGSAGIGTVDRLLELDPPVAGVLTSAAGGVRAAAPPAGAGGALSPPLTRARAPAAAAPPETPGVPATGTAPALAGALVALAGAGIAAASAGRRRGR
jgi:hypothetical protein